MTRPAILQAFPPFTDRFEGCLNYMYLDVKGLVTTGRGNLIDPLSAAMTLPWLVRDSGAAASQSQIAAEWSRVKALTYLQLRGGGAFAAHTTLRLSRQAVDALTLNKVQANDIILTKRFPNWLDLPADAQLAVHSLAWACGAYFSFPMFEKALIAEDFVTAAQEIVMNAQGNPGLVPRNVANQLLMQAAASVKANNLDPNVIHGWQTPNGQ
jgi:GH24 family phage-related lysozyme (muramidase)